MAFLPRFLLLLAGLMNFVSLLNAGTRDEVIAAIIASEEYFAQLS